MTNSTPSTSMALQTPLSSIRYVIAVASGKGGVGKSTVATNLALALGQRGHRVGLLDVDIYGPSLPIMLGLSDVRPTVDEDRSVLPLEKYGLKLMSFGFFLQSPEAVVWRGPLVSRMVQQFVQEVKWGALDYLVVDLPPGTGDAQLTLTQLIPLSGVVVVSTPQDVALADAIKGINMFKKVNTPILGLIENMSLFVCPHCKKETAIFSHGGAKAASSRLDIPFLGEIPIDTATRIAGDEGKPIVIADPKSPTSTAFARIADSVLTSLASATSAQPEFSSNLFESTLPKA